LEVTIVNQSAGKEIIDLSDRAFSFARREWYRHAFACYRRLLFEFDVQTPAILSEAGFVCWKLGIADEAETCFARALEKNASHRESLINLVGMHLEHNVVDGVDVLLDRLAMSFKEDPEVRVLRAQQKFVVGEVDQALEDLNMLLRQHRSSRVACILVAGLLIRYGYFERVINIAEEAAGTGLKNPALFDLWAQALAGRGNHEGSSHIYQRMLLDFPRNVVALTALAKLAVISGALLEGRKYAEQAFALSPGNEDVASAYFTILAKLQAWQALRDATLQIIEEGPIWEEAFLFHATSLVQLGQQKELDALIARHQTEKPGSEKIFF
jgi:tetratricopeptide (TPR) repeat protein